MEYWTCTAHACVNNEPSATARMRSACGGIATGLKIVALSYIVQDVAAFTSASSTVTLVFATMDLIRAHSELPMVPLSMNITSPAVRFVVDAQVMPCSARCHCARHCFSLTSSKIT